ncbi:MAG TPA: hypothetical protein VMJ14_00735 [Burkholderiales bacterium]|nr:hypothetical protein [Burkholderiales bacterium]
MNLAHIVFAAAVCATVFSRAAYSQSDSETVAMMAGALIAQADTCNIATAPIEKTMLNWFNRKDVASSEQQRLTLVTAQIRQAMRGYIPKGGCTEVQRNIDEFRRKLGG